MFVPGKPLQPSLLQVTYHRKVFHQGRLRPYPQTLDIRLGLKGLQRTNALAYYKNLEFGAVKCFTTLAPIVDVIKL